MFGDAVRIEDEPVVDVSTLGDKTMILAVTFDKDYSIYIVGEKGRAGLARFEGENILTSVNDSWACPTNFTQVSAIAVEVTSHDYDSLVLFYNEFKSVIAYFPSYQSIPAMKYDPTSDSIEEGSLAEKMMAMENATNNANEVIETLTIQYNRARQARIT